jgi:hypothetical protein
MDRWTRPAVQAALAGMDQSQSLGGAEPVHPMRLAVVPRAGSSSAVNRYTNSGSSKWMTITALIRRAGCVRWSV